VPQNADVEGGLAGSVSLVANEDAGGGFTAEQLASLLGSHGVQTVRVDLDRVDDLSAATSERLVVAGGDGSIGPVAAAAARLGVPLAVVPVGTANDFARVMELPSDVEDACRLAATGRKTRPLDLAFLDGLPFVNAASLGLSPEAARSASALKGVLGRFSYAAGALRAATRAEAVPVEVRADGEEIFTGSAWQVIVSNTGAFGGGSDVGEADPSDGLLDVTVIPSSGRLRLARDGLALRSGRIGRRHGVCGARGTTLDVVVRPGTAYNVDGELVEAGPARFTVERGAVRLVFG
jgi:diacylglycerol kinase (ATP)